MFSFKPEYTLDEYITEVISEYGAGNVADMIGIDPSKMSRFRAGEQGLTIEQGEKLFAIKDMVLVRRGTLGKYREHLIATVDILR